MLFGFANGAQAILTCTSSARTPGSSGDRRYRGPHRDRQPLLRTFVLHAHRSRRDATRFEPSHKGKGLHYEADEVARCLRAGLLESPLMPLDESIAIMETMDTVLAQA